MEKHVSTAALAALTNAMTVMCTTLGRQLPQETVRGLETELRSTALLMRMAGDKAAAAVLDRFTNVLTSAHPERFTNQSLQ